MAQWHTDNRGMTGAKAGGALAHLRDLSNSLICLVVMRFESVVVRHLTPLACLMEALVSTVYCTLNT
jgi:hypothetical protein